MNMNEFLTSIEDAAKSLIDLITKDQIEINNLRASIKDAQRESDDWWNSMSQGISLDEVTWRSEQAHFQLNLSEELRIQLDQIKESHAAKEISIAVLCGALLQLAKQGISLVYGNIYLPEDKCGSEVKTTSGQLIPWNKPRVGTVNLKVSDLIVAARNQSLHYEMGLEHSHNEKVFDGLHNANPRLFQKIAKSDLKVNGGTEDPKNFSKNTVLSILKWKSYEQFKKDLLSIG